jgi:hypothetical protein
MKARFAEANPPSLLRAFGREFKADRLRRVRLAIYPYSYLQGISAKAIE